MANSSFKEEEKMPKVPATPFISYELNVEPQNWTINISSKKLRNLIDYLERELRKEVDKLGHGGAPYHEQCEAARAKLHELIERIKSDAKQGKNVNMQTKLHIFSGVFGDLATGALDAIPEMEYNLT